MLFTLMGKGSRKFGEEVPGVRDAVGGGSRARSSRARRSRGRKGRGRGRKDIFWLCMIYKRVGFLLGDYLWVGEGG